MFYNVNMESKWDPEKGSLLQCKSEYVTEKDIKLNVEG